MGVQLLYLPDRNQVRSAADADVPLLAAYGWAPMPTSAGSGTQYVQAVPMGTWTIPHTMGRLPAVQIYVAGDLVEADVSATASQVVVVFASPASGVAVLS